MVADDLYMANDGAPGKVKIMQEALRLFAIKGLSTTTIRDIADAANLSNPALYKHFKTKDELALLLFKRAYLGHMSKLTHAVGDQTGFIDQFHAFLDCYLQSYDAHPHAMIFATDNLPSLWPQMPEEMRKTTAITLLRQILILGRSQRLVSPYDDINLQLSLVIGTLVQLTRQLFLGAIEGPASSHGNGVKRLLRSALR